MNASASVKRKRQTALAALQAKLTAFDLGEPRLLAAVDAVLVRQFRAQLPRMRAYVLETGVYKVPVAIAVLMDFTPGKECIVVDMAIRPPVFTAHEEVSLHANAPIPAGGRSKMPGRKVPRA